MVIFKAKIKKPLNILVVAIPIIINIPYIRERLVFYFPSLISFKPEIDSLLFSTLISTYAIFFALLTLGIQFLYPHRFIDIHDMLKDKFIIGNSLIFLLYTIIPFFAIEFLDLSDSKSNYFMLSFYGSSSIILIFLILHLIRLLDPEVSLNNIEKKIEQNLKNLIGKNDRKAFTTIVRQDYTLHLDRLYDISIVAFKSNETTLFVNLLDKFYKISMKVEKSTKDLIKLINESKNVKNNNHINKYEFVGEMIWVPLYRIRNIGELVVNDSFLRPYFNISLAVNFINSIIKEQFINSKAIITTYAIIFRRFNLKKSDPSYVKVFEVLGHGIFFMSAFLYNFFDMKKKLDMQKTIDTEYSINPFKEGQPYFFDEWEDPIYEVLYSFFCLITYYRHICKEMEYLNFNIVKNQSKEQLQRQWAKEIFQASDDDLTKFFVFFQEHIKDKYLKNISYFIL